MPGCHSHHEEVVYLSYPIECMEFMLLLLLQVVTLNAKVSSLILSALFILL